MNVSNGVGEEKISGEKATYAPTSYKCLSGLLRRKKDTSMYVCLLYHGGRAKIDACTFAARSAQLIVVKANYR